VRRWRSCFCWHFRSAFGGPFVMVAGGLLMAFTRLKSARIGANIMSLGGHCHCHRRDDRRWPSVMIEMRKSPLERAAPWIGRPRCSSVDRCRDEVWSLRVFSLSDQLPYPSCQYSRLEGQEGRDVQARGLYKTFAMAAAARFYRSFVPALTGAFFRAAGGLFQSTRTHVNRFLITVYAPVITWC